MGIVESLSRFANGLYRQLDLLRSYLLKKLLKMPLRLRRTLPLVAVIRLLSSSDSLTSKPRTGEIRALLCSPLDRTIIFVLLRFDVRHALDAAESSVLFQQLRESNWATRASRALRTWWKWDSTSALPSVAAWIEVAGSLSNSQLRVALVGVTELALSADRSLALRLFERLRPLALKRIDPYSDDPALVAQEAIAVLLAEHPALALDFVNEPLPSIPSAARKTVLLQSLGLYRSLSVKDHLGRLAPAIAENPEELVERMRKVDDRYSVSDQVVDPETPTRTYGLAVGPWVSLFSGFLAALIVLLGTGELARLGQTKLLDVSGQIPDVLLPMLGIVVAIHILAIDLASARFPRLGAATVATAPGILMTYSFLVGCLLYELIGRYLMPLDNVISDLFSSITSAIGLVFLVLVIGSLLRSQDIRIVAKRIAARHDRTAASARGNLASLITNQGNWKGQKASYRWVREQFTIPAARRHIPLKATRRGMITYDLNRLKRVDSLLEQINSRETLLRGRTREVVLLKPPGSEASQFENLAAVVSDEPSEGEHLRKELERAITTSRNDEMVRLESAVQALVIFLGLAINDGDFSAAREINLHLSALLDKSLVSADQLPKDLDVEDAIAASLPERSAVLAIERVLRSTLDRADDLACEIVANVILDLATAATYRPGSFALEYALARTDKVLDNYSDRPAVATVAALLANLGRIAFLANRGHARSVARLALEKTVVSLSSEANRGDDARFCIDRFAEMLAAAMHADYFASSHVLKGAHKLADVYREKVNATSSYAAAVSLLELGGVAFATRRYSLALDLAQIIWKAGINLEAGTQSISSRSISASIQAKSDMFGEVFGSDVEASVKDFSTWIGSIPAELVYPESSA